MENTTNPNATLITDEHRAKVYAELRERAKEIGNYHADHFIQLRLIELQNKTGTRDARE
jgi:hypothetical protein